MNYNRKIKKIYFFIATSLISLTFMSILVVEAYYSIFHNKRDSFIKIIVSQDKHHFIYVLFAIVIIILSFLFLSIITLAKYIYSQLKSQSVKYQYINNIIHDYKTPITTINLICQTINDVDINSLNNVKYYVDIINQECLRLNIMAENILNTLRLKTLKIDKYECVDIHKVLVDSIGVMDFYIKNYNGVIKNSLKAENHIVKGNYYFIFSAFANIVNNAIKYSKDSPDITIETINIEKSIIISFMDKGIGIEKNKLKKVFHKSYRISSLDVNVNEGSGLGLYFIKKNIKQLNGNIIVESDFGKGSVFKIILPVIK